MKLLRYPCLNLYLGKILIAVFLVGLGIGNPGWGLSDAEKYYDKIRVFNEILSEVQEKYVDDKKVETDQLIDTAIEGMLEQLDPYSSYLPPQDYNDFRDDTRGTFGGLGITIDIRDGWLTVISPLPDTPAFQEGILSGDKIISIEGETTKGMDVKEAVHRLRGEVGTQVTITIFRPSDQSTVDHSIVRGIIRIPNVYVYTIDEHIGYIRLLEFKQTASTDLNKALDLLDEHHIDSLILDLRFNSGGLLDMAVEVSDKFLPKGLRIVSIRGRDMEDERAYLSQRNPRTKLPLAVLINQASASASEIVAGAIQDHGRGILIGPVGKRTFGKGSVQTVIPLSNNSALKLTTAKYFTPLGRSIEDEHGLEPDIKVDIDENFQRRIIQLGKLAQLPEALGKVTRIFPEPSALPEEATPEETAPENIESATPIQEIPIPTEVIKEKPSDTKDKDADIYDRELAKAVEVLKTQAIWAKVDHLLK